jgi:hypothetical protein
MLQVHSPTSRSWILREKVHGRRCDIGLGSFPLVTLDSARHRARHVHDRILRGDEPLGADDAPRPLRRRR